MKTTWVRVILRTALLFALLAAAAAALGDFENPCPHCEEHG
jgi:hypothetical protein